MATYLHEGRMPKVGDKIWTLQLINDESLDLAPVAGVVTRVSDIDNRGLANTYVDIDVGRRQLHVNVIQLFDHKPERVQKHDAFGSYWVWD